MKIIKKPKSEKQILVAVRKEGKSNEIYQGMISRAECCVDHLCGCTS